MNQGIAKLTALFLATLAGTAAANCLTDTTQLNFQGGTLNAVDITKSPGDVLLASTSGGSGATLDQQNTTLSSSGEVFSDTQWNAQTFTAGMSGPLTRVDLNLFCYLCSGYTPPAISVVIRSTLGGADLASTTTTIDNTGAPKFYTANFPTPATLTAGQQYAIIVRASATPTRTLAFTVGSTSTYGGGTMNLSKNSGGTWTAEVYDGGFKTYVNTGASGGYVSAGDLISSLKDAAPPAGTVPTWSTLSFTDNVPANTTLRFQVAASNSSGGPFAFVGPDGTATTYFTTSGASLSRFDGNRYLKYRAYLATGSSSSTPALNDATVCYTNVTPSADLSITNSDGVTTAPPGGSVVYTISAANSGPNGVTGAAVSDTFPTSLTCSWTCTGAAGGQCPASGSGNISSLVNLPAGASVTYAATCSIANNASGTLTNSASIAAPTGVSDPNTGNNTASDSDTLQASNNIGLTMTDSIDQVKIGQVVDYVIEVTNSNSTSNASVTVGDTLPSQLTGGSWTCTAAGGATCGSASGSGNKLSDSPTLPSGSKVDYLYTATVLSADANGEVANTATVKVTASGNQSAANLSALDADVVVIFASSFEGAAKIAATTTAGTGGGSMTLHLGVDSGLAGTVGTAPVTIASGRAADGTTLFSVQLVRFGSELAMRTIIALDGGTFSDASPWAPANLKQGTLDLTWQPASARGDAGFLRAGSLPLSATNARANLAQLQIESVRGVPWLVVMAH